MVLGVLVGQPGFRPRLGTAAWRWHVAGCVVVYPAVPFGVAYCQLPALLFKILYSAVANSFTDVNLVKFMRDSVDVC